MLAELIAALIVVESGGDNLAVGDQGKAIGCLQIHREVVMDVNRIYGTYYTWPESCFNRRHAINICKLYLAHYSKPDSGKEELARKWNGGGPLGHKKQSTLKYWLKVKNEIKTKKTCKQSY